MPTNLTEQQLVALKPHIEGREVYDLGAGTCHMVPILLELGAATVVAVEKERDLMPKIDDPRVKQILAYFADVYPPTPSGSFNIDVAFVGHPQNRRDQGLDQLVSCAKTVVYVGKNTDGTACGHPDLFNALLRRRVLVYVPVFHNTLIVYGEYLEGAETRQPRGEEYACLVGNERIVKFAEAEGIVGAIGSLPAH